MNLRKQIDYQFHQDGKENRESGTKSDIFIGEKKKSNIFKRKFIKIKLEIKIF